MSGATLTLVLDPAVDLGYIVDGNGDTVPRFIDDHIRRACELLIPYFGQHANWTSLVTVGGRRYQLLELAIGAATIMLSYQGAEGVWLDDDAANMGVSGTAWTEVELRRLRDARRHVNLGGGRWQDLGRVLAEGADASAVDLLRVGDATIWAAFAVPHLLDADYLSELMRYVENDGAGDGVIPAGVGYTIVEATDLGFTFDVGPAFDEGELAHIAATSAA